MLTKVCGFYKLEAVKMKGGIEYSRRPLTDWFPNLITNQGLDRMANNLDYLNYCQVGSGSTAPANSNIGLVNRIAGTIVTSGTQGVNNTSPYYSWFTKVYRFAEGVAAGNLSEVGIGWAATGNVLFSRALILDTYQNPTTITVLSDEYLDVTYQLRFYPLETDVTGNVTLTGNIGGTYSYTLRRALITTVVKQNNQYNNYYPPSMSNASYDAGYNYVFNKAYPGSIGSISSQPSGTSVDYAGMSTTTSASYVSGSYSLDLTISMGPTEGNVPGGIKSLKFLFGFNEHQIEFGTAIPKTSQDSLSLTFRHVWARL
jgi:hypothetical protein